jgi:glucan biosynthesis protein C
MSSISNRDFSLDAARGALMLLGIFLHAAKVYSIDSGWLFADRQNNQVFNAISDVIHAFRMPAFFWISGYFCALTFARYGAEGLLQKRVPRILVPLLATLLTFNIIQKLFLAAFNGKNLIETLLNGIPLYHLWFLVDLAIFTSIAALILPKLRTFKSIGQKIEKISFSVMLLSLALLSSFMSVCARSTGFAYGSIYSLTSIFRLAEYAPFFAVGIFMYLHPTAKFTFTKTPSFTILATLPLVLLANKYTHSPSFIVSEIALFLKSIMVWLSVAAVLSFFNSFVKTNSPLIKFLSESAYSIYLFHHIFVIMVAVILSNYDFYIWGKYFIVCTASLTGAIFIHIALIRRNGVARRLFNGI